MGLRSDSEVFLAFLVAAAIAVIAPAALAVAGGRFERRFIRADLLSLAAGAPLVALVLVIDPPFDLAGVLLAIFIAARLAPTARFVVTSTAISVWQAFGLALALYLSLGVWGYARMPAQGDQPHYILAAAAIVSGDLDQRRTYRDTARYEALTGQRETSEGIEGHVIAMSTGPRLIQNYGLPLAIAPGWALLGRAGVFLTMAIIGALASLVTFLTLRDLFGTARSARVSWLVATSFAPLMPLATIAYPNILGALVIAAAFRWLITAPVPRPAVAGVLAGTTLFLTPRDGVGAIALIVAAVLCARPRLAPFAAAFGAMVVISALLHLVVYGVPLPYISYILNVRAPNLPVPDIVSLQPQVILPGMLFDRTSGYAAFAPWVFIGALGVAPLWSRARAAAIAGLILVGATVAAVSVISEWRGGWAPPGRYLAEVVPVWTIFVAAGLASASRLAARVAVYVVLSWSAFVALLYAGMPPIAYDDRLAEWFARFLPVHPLAFLPLVASQDLATTLVSSIVLAAIVVGLALLVARPPRSLAPA